jgi:hypothetical protein
MTGIAGADAVLHHHVVALVGGASSVIARTTAKREDEAIHPQARYRLVDCFAFGSQ